MGIVRDVIACFKDPLAACYLYGTLLTITGVLAQNTLFVVAGLLTIVIVLVVGGAIAHA